MTERLHEMALEALLTFLVSRGSFRLSGARAS